MPFTRRRPITPAPVVTDASSPPVKRGRGRPKGSRSKETISKELAREALREVVMEHMYEMVEAQIAQAKGLKFVVTRDATGKFQRLTQETFAAAAEEGRIEVWEKEPSTAAFTDLMNRTLDKPAEQEQTIRIAGEAELIQKLTDARQRAAVLKTQLLASVTATSTRTDGGTVQ